MTQDFRCDAEDRDEGVLPSDMLAARRRFLTGVFTATALSTTLASRRALANGNNGCGPISAICSPTPSNVQNGQTCTGRHCDYFCNDVSRWKANCKTITFGSCGFITSPSRQFSPATCLYQALNGCYTQASQQQTQTWWQTWWGQQQNKCSIEGWGQSSWIQQGCGVYVYNPSCNSSASGLAGWIACGLLNCLNPPAGWTYTTRSFVAACQTVYQCNTKGNSDALLCGVLSSICTAQPSPLGCGGTASLWANCY